jgi:hypothetical protein
MLYDSRLRLAASILGCYAAGLLFVGPVFAEAPASRSGASDEDGKADELARAVTERTGNPEEVEKLAFTFVVEVNGESKVKRRHVWRPGEGALEVRRGDETFRFEKLDEHNPTKLARAPAEHADAWATIAPETEPERAAEAWGWFINDSYWLLAPAKLFDPGVNRDLDQQGRLVLTFGDVGLTPDDRYALTIDRERGVVTRWEYELQSGRSGNFQWKDYKAFGPLYLSTRRVSEGEKSGTVIRFENIEVAE